MQFLKSCGGVEFVRAGALVSGAALVDVPRAGLTTFVATAPVPLEAGSDDSVNEWDAAIKEEKPDRGGSAANRRRRLFTSSSPSSSPATAAAPALGKSLTERLAAMTSASKRNHNVRRCKLTSV